LVITVWPLVDGDGGGAADPRTTAVWTVVAEAEPALFVAVTRERTVWPMSRARIV